MKKRTSPTRQHVVLVLFALGLIELLLFLLAIIFGREVGYAAVFSVCAWFGAIVLTVFLFIIALNLFVIGAENLYMACKRKKLRKNYAQHGDHEQYF